MQFLPSFSLYRGPYTARIAFALLVLSLGRTILDFGGGVLDLAWLLACIAVLDVLLRKPERAAGAVALWALFVSLGGAIGLLRTWLAWDHLMGSRRPFILDALWAVVSLTMGFYLWEGRGLADG